MYDYRSFAGDTEGCLPKGDSNEVIPPDGAFFVQEQLVNAKDGAKLYFIRGICALRSSDVIYMLIRGSRCSRVSQYSA
jgi:hypothetical protein